MVASYLFSPRSTSRGYRLDGGPTSEAVPRVQRPALGAHLPGSNQREDALVSTLPLPQTKPCLKVIQDIACNSHLHRVCSRNGKKHIDRRRIRWRSFRYCFILDNTWGRLLVLSDPHTPGYVQQNNQESSLNTSTAPTSSADPDIDHHCVCEPPRSARTSAAWRPLQPQHF